MVLRFYYDLGRSFRDYFYKIVIICSCLYFYVKFSVLYVRLKDFGLSRFWLVNKGFNGWVGNGGKVGFLWF